jgi:hypothetical protein
MAAITFSDFVAAVRVEVDDLIAAESVYTIEGPSFVWDSNGEVARWRRRHMWAVVSNSPETGPLHGALLVLGRDPEPTGPFGAQAAPLPFAADVDNVDRIAGAIAGHFEWPA